MAVTEAIRERIGKQQGKRTDRLQDKYPEVPKRVQTREHAAKSAGFESDFSYRQAKAVVEHGTADLVRAMAMDSGGNVPGESGTFLGQSRETMPLERGKANLVSACGQLDTMATMAGTGSGNRWEPLGTGTRVPAGRRPWHGPVQGGALD